MDRRVVAVVAIGALLLAGAAAAVVHDRSAKPCGHDVTRHPAAESASPFLGVAGRRAQPDRDRDALVTALEAAPAPYGPVLGAVGYHYGQWAQLSAYAQGLGVRTRDNPDFTLLDDRTLEPMWSVEVRTERSTYDASASRYLVATMPTGTAPELVSLDATTGERQWCARLGGPPVGSTDPFATQLTADGGVVVLGPGTRGRERVVRLDPRGGRSWTREVDTGAGDYLGTLGRGLLLAGGGAAYALADPRELGRRPQGAALVALDARTGETEWTMERPAGTDVHVVGVDGADGSTAVVQQRSSDGTGRLLGLDDRGGERWSVDPSAGRPFDVALRSGRVLVRVGTRWSAYDARSGRLLWRRSVPTTPQLLPYGFTLDSVPSLDDDHVVVGSTTALRTLDLRTGTMTEAALPTDGISTTYWPYEVVVTASLVAVATNTGAVVVRRQ